MAYERCGLLRPFTDLYRLKCLTILVCQNILDAILNRGFPGSRRTIQPPMRKREMVEMEDRWLSVEEIGKYLGVSNDTVHRWIDKHDMPAHKIGRLWKFKKDEIDEWVRNRGTETD